MAMETCEYVPVKFDEEDHGRSHAAIPRPDDHHVSAMEEGCTPRAFLENDQKPFQVDHDSKPRLDSVPRQRLSSLDVFRGLTVIV